MKDDKNIEILACFLVDSAWIITSKRSLLTQVEERKLFEHTGKMSEEETDALSKKIAALFRESADEALSYVQEQARKHWSDSSVLKTLALTTFSCLPQLDGSQDKPVVGKAYECVVVMERLYRRIIALQPVGEAAQDDLSFLLRFY